MLEVVPHMDSYDHLYIYGGIGIFLFFLVIIAIIVGIVIAVKNKNRISSPDTNKAIEAQQIKMLEDRWTGITQTKKGIDNAFTSIPSDQKLLINTSVLSTRLTGYLGPFDSGVFSEDAAVRLALSTGARCLILEIDYLDSNPSEPVLLYRDASGYKLSNNAGNLNNVAKSIAARAFKTSNDSVPPGVASDPLIIVLYFRRTPVKTILQPKTDAKNQILFFSNVAKALTPIKGLLIGQTDRGDFRRQAQQSQLFYYPTSIFKNRIILMTNADLNVFRNKELLGFAGLVSIDNDLDFMTHVRLYSRESSSGLGVTSLPSSTVKPAAVITTPSYWINTPTDKLNAAIDQTKSAWTLVMEPSATTKNTISKDNLNKLLKQYGVHSVPLCIFDDISKTDSWTSKNAQYEKNAWSVKNVSLRYVPPKPIVVLKASNSFNTKGGVIKTPNITSTTKSTTTVKK